MSRGEPGPFTTRMEEHALRAAVIRNRRDLESYVRRRYPRDSFHGVLEDILGEHPSVAWTIIQNHRLSNEERWERIIRHYAQVEGNVTLTVGRKRGFKTTINWDVAYEIHERTGRRVFFIGDPDQAPDWAYARARLSDVPDWSIAIQDELAIEQNARDAMRKDQRGVGGQLAVIGHNRIILLAIVQNSSLGDRNFWTLADDFLIKPLSTTQQYTERRGAMAMLKPWREMLPKQDRRETLFISQDMHPLMVTRERPEWLPDSASRAYARIPTQQEAVRVALRLAHCGISCSRVASKMEARGWKRTDKTWKAWVTAANGGIDPWEQEAETVAAQG